MTSDRFQLTILRGDWGSLGLGYAYDGALPKLTAATDALFTIGTDQIETYHWNDQSITLTPEGTRALLAALQPPEELSEGVRGRNSMWDKLGWGDRLDHALYTKGFLVKLNGEPLYGGIFMDATSQMAIRYPVIRAGLTADGRAQFNLLPVHVAFYTKDPHACAGNDEAAIARQMVGDWKQFPEGTKALIARWGATETATTLRALLRSAAIRVIMEEAKKLR